MPLILSGKQVGPEQISWFRLEDSQGANDRTLVLQMNARLFMNLPGLRTYKSGWTVDMFALSLSIADENWIPQRGSFHAEVSALAVGYEVTLKF